MRFAIECVYFSQAHEIIKMAQAFIIRTALISVPCAIPPSPTLSVHPVAAAECIVYFVAWQTDVQRVGVARGCEGERGTHEGRGEVEWEWGRVDRLQQP